MTQTLTKQVLILRKCHQGNWNDFFSSSHGPLRVVIPASPRELEAPPGNLPYLPPTWLPTGGTAFGTSAACLHLVQASEGTGNVPYVPLGKP